MSRWREQDALNIYDVYILVDLKCQKNDITLKAK